MEKLYYASGQIPSRAEPTNVVLGPRRIPIVVKENQEMDNYSHTVDSEAMHSNMRVSGVSPFK